MKTSGLTESVHQTSAAAHTEIQRQAREDSESPRQREINSSPRVTAQRRHLEGLAGTLQRKPVEEEEPVQKKSNNTGLPDNLKSGIEGLSGHSMDDVRVHYNSPKPAAVQAHAYAQGADIHLASGQESHLPHEAWHVAQQKQGRVKPNLSVNGMSVNDDAGLEREADVMGSKASATKL